MTSPIRASEDRHACHRFVLHPCRFACCCCSSPRVARRRPRPRRAAHPLARPQPLRPATRRLCEPAPALPPDKGPVPEVASPYDALPEGSRTLLDQAVHRRPRRDGEAPDRPRGRGVQPDAVLHRQGRAEGHRLRVGQALRGGAEQASQDRPVEGARRLRPDVTRPALPGPRVGQGGRGGRRAHRDPGAPEARGVQQPDADQRVGGRRHERDGGAGARSGRPVRPRGLPQEEQQLLRQRRCAEPVAREPRQGAGRHQGGPRGARRRRPARDGERRPGRGDHRRRLHREVLEGGLPGHRRQSGRRGAHGRGDRDCRPQEQPEDDQGGEHLDQGVRPEDGLREHDRAAVSPEHGLREGRRRRGRPQEAPRAGGPVQEVRRPVLAWTTC